MVVNCQKQDSFYIDRSSKAIELYFKEIRQYPILSASEQRELVEKAQHGDKSARDRLVKCNQLFIASIARKYQTEGNFLDIVNEGNIGLLIAIDNFDLSKDNRFLTYAVHWIRKQINDYNANVARMFTTKNAVKLYTYARKVRDDFFIKNERYPTLEELKYELKARHNVCVKDKYDLEKFELNTINEGAKPNEADDGEFSFMANYYAKSSVNNINEQIDKEDVCKKVGVLLAGIDEHAREIVKRMYGIGNDIQESADTIAKDMGISVVTVRKIVKESIKKMKQCGISK